MKLILISFFAFAVQHNHTYACTNQEACLHGLTNEIATLIDTTQPVLKEALRKHWYLLLKKDDLVLQAGIKAAGRKCSDIGDLVFTPEDSPLGQHLRNNPLGKIKFITRKRLNEMLPKQNSGGIFDPKLAEVIHQQEEWMRNIDTDDLKKRTIKFRQEYKSYCIKDISSSIEKKYADLFADYEQLNDLKETLNKIRFECLQTYPNQVTEQETDFNNIYSKSKDKISTYERMKFMALLGCTAPDLIEALFSKNKNSCSQYIKDVYHLIDPECSHLHEKSINACNGLHNHIVASFINNEAYDDNLRVFLALLKNANSVESSVEIPQIAMIAADGDPLLAWRMIGLLGHDEINSSMRMIRDQMLKRGQYKRFIQAADLYTAEKSVLVENNDTFYGKVFQDIPKEQNLVTFYKLITSNGTFAGKKIKGRYYHYIAGAVVACELRKKGYSDWQAKLAATSTGLVYEIFDFESHTHVLSNLADLARTPENKRSPAFLKAGGDQFRKLKTYEEYIEIFKTGAFITAATEKQKRDLYAKYVETYHNFWREKNTLRLIQDTEFRASWQNLVNDTSHHHHGGALGSEMCK